MPLGSLQIERYERALDGVSSGYLKLVQNNEISAGGRLFGRVAARLSSSDNLKIKKDFKASLKQRYGDDVLDKLRDKDESLRARLNGKQALSVAVVNDIFTALHTDQTEALRVFVKNYVPVHDIKASGLYKAFQASGSAKTALEAVKALDQHIDLMDDADARRTAKDAVFKRLCTPEFCHEVRLGILQLDRQKDVERRDIYEKAHAKVNELVSNALKPLLDYLDGVDALENKGVLTPGQAQEAKRAIIEHGKPQASENGLIEGLAAALGNGTLAPLLDFLDGLEKLAANGLLDPGKALAARNESLKAGAPHLAGITGQTAFALLAFSSKDGNAIRNLAHQANSSDFRGAMNDSFSLAFKKLVQSSNGNHEALRHAITGLADLQDKEDGRFPGLNDYLNDRFGLDFLNPPTGKDAIAEALKTVGKRGTENSSHPGFRSLIQDASMFLTQMPTRLSMASAPMRDRRKAIRAAGETNDVMNGFEAQMKLYGTMFTHASFLGMFSEDEKPMVKAFGDACLAMYQATQEPGGTNLWTQMKAFVDTHTRELEALKKERATMKAISDGVRQTMPTVTDDFDKPIAELDERIARLEKLATFEEKQKLIDALAQRS